MEKNTRHAESFDQLEKIIDSEGGFIWAPWDGNIETAQKIQEKTKASIRLLGNAEDSKGKKDVLSGNPAKEMALYAKAY